MRRISSNKVILLIFVLLIVASVGLGFAQWRISLGEQSQIEEDSETTQDEGGLESSADTTPGHPSEPIFDQCSAEEREVLSVVILFENTQSEREQLGEFGERLEFFTPPTWERDRRIYGFLKGSQPQALSQIFNRAIVDFRLESHKVTSSPQSIDISTCAVEVDERRIYYREGVGGWFPPTTRHVQFTLVKTNDDWMIDKYLSLGQDGKYSGWISDNVK